MTTISTIIIIIIQLCYPGTVKLKLSLKNDIDLFYNGMVTTNLEFVTQFGNTTVISLPTSTPTFRKNVLAGRFKILPGCGCRLYESREIVHFSTRKADINFLFEKMNYF